MCSMLFHTILCLFRRWNSDIYVVEADQQKQADFATFSTKTFLSHSYVIIKPFCQGAMCRAVVATYQNYMTGGTHVVRK